MQIYGSPYRTCTECGLSVLRTEGPFAFYRSFTTQLSMNIPFQVIHFMTYEFMQDILNPSRAYDPLSHGVSGAVAGAAAAAATMPLDVCKTLLNTQEQCARTSNVSYVNGMAAAFRTVYEFQGVKGYFRGLTARVFYQMPSTAISWSIYEFFKMMLNSKSPEKDDGGYLTIKSLQAETNPVEIMKTRSDA